MLDLQEKLKWYVTKGKRFRFTTVAGDNVVTHKIKIMLA